MAKKVILKSKDGVEVSFAVNQITIKGETVIKFPDGTEWSDGAAKNYAYGESYLAKIPDEIFAQIASMLIPAPIEEASETGNESEAQGGTE